VNAPVAIANSGCGDFADSHAELGLIVGLTLVGVQRPGDERDTACPADAYVVIDPEVVHQLPTATRPQSFFDSTS
jgi:hypothetical protein